LVGRRGEGESDRMRWGLDKKGKGAHLEVIAGGVRASPPLSILTFFTLFFDSLKIPNFFN